MRTKYFITPFGVSGTITPAVPNATDPSGFVSYSQGWTFDYQRDLTTDPLAKSPTYTNFNAILNDITTSLQALQQGGVAEFITTSDNSGSAFSYGLGALVLWSSGGTPPFNLYLSLINANTALPSVTANWLDLTTFHSFPYGPLNTANTWTATQTHTQPIVMANNIGILGKDTGGTPRNMLSYGSDSRTHIFGGSAGFSITNFAVSQDNLVVDDNGNVLALNSFLLPNNKSYYGTDTGGTPRPMLDYDASNNVSMFLGTGGLWRVASSNGVTQLAALNTTGDLFITGVSKPAAGILVGTTSNPIANVTNGLQTLANGSSQIYNASLSPLSLGIGSTTPALIGFFFGSTAVATITTNGSSVAYNNNVVSDYRIKTTYGLVSNSGAVIDAVPVYDAEYNVGSSHPRAMFLAHEFGELVPDAVSGLKDAVTETGDIIPQYLDVSAAIPYLWAEAQSLRQRTAALEAANATLQTALTSVLARLVVLEAR